MGVGNIYKKVPETLHRFATLNFKDETFVGGRVCNT